MGVCVVLVVALGLWLGGDTSPASSTENQGDTTADVRTPLTPEEMAAYNVTMTNQDNPKAEFVTNLGTFTLEIYNDVMPTTAGNFIKLAEEGFYDGTKFHRVIPGFMIQGGDPLTKTGEVMRYGTGGPGYTIPDEHVRDERLTNIRGTIAMANSGPNTGGSQFFINVADNTFLDFDKEPLQSQHPVFGQVLSGMAVVDAIAQVERNPADMPLEPVIVERVRIIHSS